MSHTLVDTITLRPFIGRVVKKSANSRMHSRFKHIVHGDMNFLDSQINRRKGAASHATG